MPTDVKPLHEKTRLAFLAATVTVGVVVALVAPTPSNTALDRLLIGFVISAALFTSRNLFRIMHADAQRTRELLDGLDAGRQITDVLVVTACVASVGGIMMLLLASRSHSPAQQIQESALAVATVAAAWFSVHTMYAVRYARHWFNSETGCIDFNSDADPRLSDFAYLAFAVAMTYAISDTNLKTSAVRRIALGQSMIAYLLGTVIVASTINLLSSLAG